MTIISDSCQHATADFIYTEEELDDMNGAIKEEGLPSEFVVDGASEDIFKREVWNEPDTNFVHE